MVDFVLVVSRSKGESNDDKEQRPLIAALLKRAQDSIVIVIVIDIVIISIGINCS